MPTEEDTELDSSADLGWGSFDHPDDRVWERVAGRSSKKHHMISSLSPTNGLEEILEPLKMLRNVDYAKINLTPGAEKDGDMRALVDGLQNSMMHNGLRQEIELSWKDCGPFDGMGIT